MPISRATKGLVVVVLLLLLLLLVGFFAFIVVIVLVDLCLLSPYMRSCRSSKNSSNVVVTASCSGPGLPLMIMYCFAESYSTASRR